MKEIVFENICKSYGKNEVVKDLNLTIKEGERLILLGPSGCGKSTTLRIIAGLEDITSGKLYMNGKCVNNIPSGDRNVSMVFQNYALFPHMTVKDNITYGLKVHKVPKEDVENRLLSVIDTLKLNGLEDRKPKDLSGGQRQRVALARALVKRSDFFLLDEPLSNLDAQLRGHARKELVKIHGMYNQTFVYVTHDQEEALTLSDTIVVMSEGKIQQIGTPIDIYNEPINSFVANFIGESNILNGTMIHDKLVRFCGTEFECVDEGFGENTPVDVVIRPEDLYIFPVSDMAQLTGVVQTSIFKGVHYEMTVLCGGYEFLVQDYHHFEVGAEVGLLVKPFDIHIMKKERGCNTFEGKLLDTTHVEFLGCNFECVPVEGIESNEDVKVEVDFDKVVLQDNEEDGTLTGEVKFILYKGDHYHLTVFSDWDENVFVDTNDVWDDGDRVGITIPPDAIRVIKITD